MTKIRLLTAAAALTSFILTAYSVGSTLSAAAPGTSPLAFDSAVQQAFFSLRTSWTDPLVIALTHLGDTSSIVFICIVLLVLPKTRLRYGLPVSAAAIAASSLNHYLKSVFMRPRPDSAFFLIEQGGWSFPSGHSISALVVFGILILLIRYYAKADCGTPAIRRRTSILTALLLIPCFGIGLSRIYVGVHYPTDVLAGWFLGIIVIAAVMEAVDRFYRR